MHTQPSITGAEAALPDVAKYNNFTENQHLVTVLYLFKINTTYYKL